MKKNKIFVSALAQYKITDQIHDMRLSICTCISILGVIVIKHYMFNIYLSSHTVKFRYHFSVVYTYKLLIKRKDLYFMYQRVKMGQSVLSIILVSENIYIKMFKSMHIRHRNKCPLHRFLTSTVFLGTVKEYVSIMK